MEARRLLVIVALLSYGGGVVAKKEAERYLHGTDNLLKLQKYLTAARLLVDGDWRGGRARAPARSWTQTRKSTNQSLILRDRSTLNLICFQGTLSQHFVIIAIRFCMLLSPIPLALGRHRRRRRELTVLSTLSETAFNMKMRKTN